MPLMAENIGFHTGGRHERFWIDDFERVIGEVRYLLLTKDLKRSANVNVGKAERVTDLALTERQLKSFARLDRETAANPDIKLQEQMRDALPGVSKADIGEVVMRARLICHDLAAEKDG